MNVDSSVESSSANVDHVYMQIVKQIYNLQNNKTQDYQNHSDLYHDISKALCKNDKGKTDTLELISKIYLICICLFILSFTYHRNSKYLLSCKFSL